MTPRNLPKQLVESAWAALAEDLQNLQNHSQNIYWIITARSILCASYATTTSEAQRCIMWLDITLQYSTVQYRGIDWVTECFDMMQFHGSLYFLNRFIHHLGMLGETIGGASEANSRSFTFSFIALFGIERMLCLATLRDIVMHRQDSIKQTIGYNWCKEDVQNPDGSIFYWKASWFLQIPSTWNFQRPCFACVVHPSLRRHIRLRPTGSLKWMNPIGPKQYYTTLHNPTQPYLSQLYPRSQLAHWDESRVI